MDSNGLRKSGQVLGQQQPLHGNRTFTWRIGGNFVMLWTIFAILVILWLLGLGFHIAGPAIHLLLIIAVMVLIVNLLTGHTEP